MTNENPYDKPATYNTNASNEETKNPYRSSNYPLLVIQALDPEDVRERVSELNKAFLRASHGKKTLEQKVKE